MVDKSCVSKMSSILSLLNSKVAAIEVTYRGLIYVNSKVALYHRVQNSHL
jgi:hypothetical protein